MRKPRKLTPQGQLRRERLNQRVARNEFHRMIRCLESQQNQMKDLDTGETKAFRRGQLDTLYWVSNVLGGLLHLRDDRHDDELSAARNYAKREREKI